MCVVNAFKLWSKGQQHLGQLRFREELMHELLQQYTSQRRAAPPRAASPPVNALAKDHFLEHVDERRDCVVCSHQPADRVRTQLICHACKVHLCLGQCFAEYHMETPVV